MPLTLLLRTANLEETRNFYESLLGFEAFDTAVGIKDCNGYQLAFCGRQPGTGPAA